MTLTPNELHKLFEYRADTGELIWKERLADPGKTKLEQRGVTIFNKTHAGKAAGVLSVNGYIALTVNSKKTYGHTVAWVMCHGEMPRHQIDHVNGNRADNRIENLRDVPQSKNMRNKAIQSNNTSGCTGVCWCKRRNRWLVRIQTPEGKTKQVGRYKELDEAVAARKKAEFEYGYHENHGRPLTELKKPA